MYIAMTKTSEKSNKIIVASIIVLALVFSATAAFAHNYVFVPDSFNVTAGSTAGFYNSATEIIGKAEYSRWATASYVYAATDYPTEVFYKDGSTETITNFQPYDYAKKSVVPDEEANSDYATFTVSKPGTVVITGKFTGTQNEAFGGGQSYSYVKTFINLTGDGMATKRFAEDDSNRIEAVFAAEIPSDGLKEGSAVTFRFYHKGAALINAPVFASYIGAPEYEVDEDGRTVTVNEYLEKVTDSNGEATFLLDHAAGWFVGGFVDSGKDPEYGGGIMFAVSENPEAEVELTDFIIAAGSNRAGIGFPSFGSGANVDLMRQTWGHVNASNLVTKSPRGMTSFLTEQEKQLPGSDTGVTIRIPLDIEREGLRGATGSEQAVTFTPEMLGENVFNNMVAYLKKDAAEFPGKVFTFPGYGSWYVPYTPKELFDSFGIAIMGRFSDGPVLDISDVFQIGVVYDESEFDSGRISFMYGAVLVDSAPVDGAHWIDATNVFFPAGNPNKFALILDGAADNEINFSYWLTKTDDGPSNSGGGCNAGFAGMVTLCLLGGFAVRARKMGKK